MFLHQKSLKVQRGFIAIKILLLGIFIVTLYLFFNNPFDAKAVTDITACQTISGAGNYRLTTNIGSGGTCITATVSGVDIDGGDFTINGDIVADAPDGISSGLQITLRNITIQGNVYSRGYQSTSTGTAGGTVNVIDSTIQGDIYVTGGIGVSWSQATLGETAQAGAHGGTGGTVSLTDSTVANIYATGGSGASGQQGFNGDALGNVYGGAGGNGGNGGTGGQVEALRSTISGIVTVAGGEAGLGGAGGNGFTGESGQDSSSADAAWGNPGGPAGTAGDGGAGGVGGSITLTDSTATTVTVSGAAGANGGAGGVGGGGGNGGNAIITGINAGSGADGNTGGTGGNGGNAGNAGTATLLRSTVTTVYAVGGASGAVGAGGNGGVGGNGGNAPDVPGAGQAGNAGSGGNGGSTGSNFGQPGNGGSVTVTDTSVTNINIAAGQAGSPGAEGQGGAAGTPGTGWAGQGFTGVAGNNGMYLGNASLLGFVGSISLVNNPPSIQITGDNPLDITVNSSFVDPGTTIQDAKDSNLVASVSGSVNTAVLGEYILTYTVTDTGISPLVDGVSVPEYIAAAQNDLKTRTVRVVAQQVPVVQTITPGGASGVGFTSSQTSIPAAPQVPAQPLNIQVSLIDKIISIFTGRKADSEIIQILSKPETQSILEADMSQKDAKPFDNTLEQNLKILGVTKCPVFTETIVPNNKDNNADQVRVWQKFYNHLFGSNLQVTGGYDAATIAETNRFQRVFKNTVLVPWGIEEPTGNIYITTRFAANSLIGCDQK